MTAREDWKTIEDTDEDMINYDFTEPGKGYRNAEEQEKMDFTDTSKRNGNAEYHEIHEYTE